MPSSEYHGQCSALAEAQAVLEFYPVRCRSTRVRHLGSAGGFSGAEFWRISAPEGELVLRRWPQEYPPFDRLRFIHHVLHYAMQRGLDILPVPISTKSGDSWVSRGGHFWELARWLPGKADYATSQTETKLAAAMHALARFHQATIEYGDSSSCGAVAAPAIVERLRRLRQLEQGEPTLFELRFDPSVMPELSRNAGPFLAIVAELMFRVTEPLSTLADETFSLQPCIRDIWHDHVLFTAERVTGLIDFGAMRMDLPAVDVARLLGSLASNDSVAWRTGLAAYQSIRPLSDIERKAVIALDAAGVVLGGCNWLRWVLVEKRVFAQQNEIVARRFADLLGRLQYLRRFGPPLLA